MNIDQIEKALEPFVKALVDYPDELSDDIVIDDTLTRPTITIGNLRRAREALAALRSAKDEVSEAAVEAAFSYAADRDMGLSRGDVISILIAARNAREI